MGFPAKLTDEENALIAKFALVKKKRKAQNLKTTTKNNNDDSDPIKAKNIPKKDPPVDNIIKPAKIAKTAKKEIANTSIPIAPKDAKEKAKQLLASGQLKINKGTENRSFKRARVSSTNPEKKKELPGSAESASSSNKEHAKRIDNIKKDSYKNFVASRPLDLSDSDDESKKTEFPNKNNKCFENVNKPRFENKNFDRNNDNKNDNNRNFDSKNNFNKGQNNLFVTGYGLNKEMLDKSFPQFGQIKTVYFDQDKGHGFVTYFRNECAAAAIEGLHGEMVQGTTLRVMYARRRNNHDNKFDDNRYTWRQRGNNRHSDDMEKPRDLDSAPSESSKPPRSTDRMASSKTTPEKKDRKLVSYDDTVLNYDENSFEFQIKGILKFVS